MELRQIRALGGPNVWARVPILEICLVLGEVEDSPCGRMPGFEKRLTEWLPSLAKRRRSPGSDAAFLDQLADLRPAGVVTHLALELQSLAGADVGFGRTVPTADPGVYRLVIEYEEEELARSCATLGRDLCQAAIDDRTYDAAAEIQEVRDLADRVCLGPSTRAIVRAAKARDIPVFRLNTRSLVQLGHGAAQRRILTAETQYTNVIGEYVSQDKELTKRLLRSAGVPVPQGRLVSGPADAWAAAGEIGLPVVVKPLNGNHGRGVFTDLDTREEIEAAFPIALIEGDGVLVERHARGAEHRLLVVGDRLVAAMRGDPAVVVGDGRRTIPQLVEELNQDPRRGDEYDCPLAKVDLAVSSTQSLIRIQGYRLDSVPPAGATVLLQRNGNLAIDVTDQVHPEVARCAILAARVVGLDVAGVDIVAEDIGRPLEEQRGAVVEVNASPGLQMHVQPAAGRPRPVGEAIVEHLFSRAPGRIPIVGVLDGPDAPRTIRLLEGVLQAAFGNVGVHAAEGARLDGRRIELGAGSTADRMRGLLANPCLASALLQVMPADVLGEGLGFDRCQVAVIVPCGAGVPPATRAAGTAAPQAAETAAPQDRADACRVLLEAVAPGGAVICRADDPLASQCRVSEKGTGPICRNGPKGASHKLDLSPFPSSGTLILVAEDAQHPVLRDHCDRGGTVAFVRAGAVILAQGRSEQWSVPLPAPTGRTDIDSTQAALSALVAVAAAWSLCIPRETAAAALNS